MPEVKEEDDPTDGFTVWPRSSPFGDAAGPLLFRQSSHGVVFALRIRPAHTNARGRAHGGALATAADVALGSAAALSTDPPTHLVTVSMTIDFIAPVKLGDVVLIHPRVLRLGSRLAHVRGELAVEGRVVAHASLVSAVVANNA